MRILLLKMNSAADEVIPPLSLGYLASTVRNRHEVTIIDLLRENLGPDYLRNVAAGFDVAGISLFTKDLRLCRNHLEILKAANPGIITVLGGPHPSTLPEDTLRIFGKLCDYVFAGESEVGFPKLIEFIERGTPAPESIEGLCYRSGSMIRLNPFSCPDEIGKFSVSWDLISPSRYPEAPHGAFYRNFPVAPIITSRGCPFHCTFCGGHIISGRKIRQRSVDSVIEEIALLHDRYGVREIHIEDDNFTFRKEYVLEFCSRLKERFPAISWTCPNGVRLDTIDNEMLVAIKDSGCYSLTFGLESGNNDTLKAMKKALTVEKAREKIDMIAGSGIDLNAFFILGYPGETKEHVERTIKFALSLPLKRASFANFQPFPGTEAYQLLKEAGLLQVNQWENFNPSLQSTIWSPPGFTTGELASYRRKALLRFYLRPRIILHFFRGIRTPRHFLYICRRAFRWLTFTGNRKD